MKKELYENIYKENFSFGKNWKQFLKKLNPEKINDAKNSLIEFTGLQSFEGKTFLDLGCGSGLFSLCALELGAKKVISVDVDDSSVECAKFLRERFNYGSGVWEIKKGSALDEEFIQSLPKVEIVYSWGVLHHTGDMYKAFRNVISLVKPEGMLYLAIYNKFEGTPSSKTWLKIKKFYSSRGFFVRKVMEIIYITYYVLGLILYGRNPIKYIKQYNKESFRGMNFYSDAVDWLGGYPYEFANAWEIREYFEENNYNLVKTKKTNREGCNEFLFEKLD